MRLVVVVWVVVWAGLVVGGCLRPGEFHCATDADCAATGSRCEVGGYCSFVDSTCTSGSRFGEHSGPVANQCVGDRGTDAGIDSPVTVDTPTDGPLTWGTPVALANLNSSDDESDPSLTDDGLEIFFVSDRPGLGGFDIYRATRATVGDAFGNPAIVNELSTNSQEFSPEISDDGLTIYFTSNRNGDFDVFTATRPDRASLFVGVTTDNQLSSASDDITLGLSTDRLVAVVSRALGGAAAREHFLHTRNNIMAAFSSGAVMPTINAPGNDVGATLDQTGLAIVFHSDRNAAANAFDLYTSTRLSVGVDFPTPSPITELNSGDAESNAFISSDVRRMVFARDPGGNRDLFETTR